MQLGKRIKGWQKSCRKKLYEMYWRKLKTASSYVCLADNSNYYVINANDSHLGVKLLMGSEHLDSKICRFLDWCNSETSVFDERRSLVINVGANIGTMITPLITNGYFLRGLAFEPEPQNFRLLCTNLALNELDNNVLTYCMALSNVAGAQQMYLSKKNHGAHTILSESGKLSARDNRHDFSDHSIEVHTTTLDKFIKDTFPSALTDAGLLVVDIEGHEGFFLQGAERFLNETKIPILIEFAPDSLRNRGCLNNFLEILEKYYSKVVIDPLKNTGGEYMIESIEKVRALSGSRYVHDLFIFN